MKVSSLSNRTQEMMSGVDLLPILEELGVSLSYHSHDKNTLHGLCPFLDHDDKTPSFGINISSTDKNGLWICSCGSGMFPEFVMKVLDVDFSTAMKFLNNFIEGNNYSNYILNDASIAHNTLTKYVPLTEPPNFYAKEVSRIDDHPFISSYLCTKRKYAQNQTSALIEHFNIKKSNDKKVCRNWIIIPIFDDNGLEVSWIGQNPYDRSKFHGGGMTGVLFNINNIINKYKYVLVVESIWCVLRLHTFGIPSVATMGARIDDWQVHLLRKYFNEIYLCFDNDDAGNRARGKAISKMHPAKVVYNIDMPLGIDPDKSTKEEMLSLINCASRV